MRLTVCPACHRHLRADEPRCPFCRRAMPEVSGIPGRAAVALGIGLAVGGCSSSSKAPMPSADGAYAAPPATAFMSGTEEPDGGAKMMVDSSAPPVGKLPTGSGGAASSNR